MSVFYLSEISSFSNIMQLMKLLFILLLVLVACYYVTKWLGTSGIMGGNSKNFKTIETYRMAQNKYLQIVKVGEKYLLISITKDHIEYLTELSEEDINLETNLKQGEIKSFKEILSKINKNQINKQK